MQPMQVKRCITRKLTFFVIDFSLCLVIIGCLTIVCGRPFIVFNCPLQKINFVHG